MDRGLGACFHTGHPIAHAVQAGLGGVDFDEILELRFASMKLVFPALAFRLAFIHHLVFGILSLLQHF